MLSQNILHSNLPMAKDYLAKNEILYLAHSQFLECAHKLALEFYSDHQPSFYSHPLKLENEVSVQTHIFDSNSHSWEFCPQVTPQLLSPSHKPNIEIHFQLYILHHPVT